jgi:hypothetical protein
MVGQCMIAHRTALAIFVGLHAAHLQLMGGGHALAEH